MSSIKYFGFFIAIICIVLGGCSSTSMDNSPKESKTNLVYEETLSPNELYVTSEENKVYYNIEINQDEKNFIIVEVKANTPFFEKKQYILDYNKKISKEDVNVTWTTLMGNPKASEDDQYAIAQITISHDGKVLSDRKINFSENAMEILGEILNHK